MALKALMPSRSRARDAFRVAYLLLLLLPAAVVLAGCRPAARNPVEAVKLLVDEAGVYEVSAADLAAVGFDLAGAPTEQLALSSGGQAVAFELAGSGRRAVLRFYGQPLGPEAHTATNAYFLSRVGAAAPIAGSAAKPLRIESWSAGEVPAQAAQVVTSTLVLEEEQQYRVLAQPGEAKWVWQMLYAPREVSVEFELSGLAAGDALLRVYLIGNSADNVDPDHHLILALNGEPVADAAWDGRGSHVISATVPAGVLEPGRNSLKLQMPGDTGAAADAVLLDRIELAYPRELVLEGGELAFGGDAAAYAVRVKERPALVWDISEPLVPVSLAGYAVEQGTLSFSAPPGANQQYIVATEAGMRTPRISPLGEVPDLRDWPDGADLIIVTVPEFREVLQPLVERRRGQGLRVAVVDVEQVYDSFTDGRAGPEAIRLLVREALRSWSPPAPRFLLLAGDASYDPRGHLQGSEVDLVPTGSVYTSYSGWSASDVWYAISDDAAAGQPGLAVGRLPAQTPEQLAAMVAKVLAYERGGPGAGSGWHRQALLISDNDEAGFSEEAGAFANALAGYASSRVTIEGDGAAARNTLLRAFEDGTGLIGYFGHGSVTLWAQEKVLATEDIADMNNAARLPVVFTVTCLSGFFEHPTTPSLGETLLRREGGGAVAALVPSSAAVLADQRLLAQSLASALAEAGASGEPAALGEVVVRAQRALPDTKGAREILLTFNLLGDPTLYLQP